MKKLKSDETLDRLSELPDKLILKILSFLGMRDVVRTTLLSKRWLNLWMTIPCLDFNESGKSPVKTRNFINRVLLRWKGTNVQKFGINFLTEFDASLSGDVDFWVRFAKEKRVEELSVYLPLESNPVYELPQCVYSCSSITQLSLNGCNLQIPRNVEFDQLKRLTLHGFCFGEDVISQVVSSSPQLEIFDLLLTNSHDQNLNIKSSSLKRLSIIKNVHSSTTQYDPSSYTELTIYAPKLEALAISGASYSKCLLMDVSSLTDASLGFHDKWDDAVGETLRQILPTIHHVEALTLSPCCFKMLEVMMKGKYSFSPFSNVKILKFSGGPIEPNEIVGLVEFFPMVEKLLIDWKLDTCWYPLFLENLLQKQDNIGEPETNNLIKSFLTKLRTVEVTWYSYEASIFQFIEFLLKHATMVQKVLIHKGGNEVVESRSMVLAAQGLMSLHRSFPTVDMIFCHK